MSAGAPPAAHTKGPNTITKVSSPHLAPLSNAVLYDLTFSPYERALDLDAASPRARGYASERRPRARVGRASLAV